ncbi:MAG TPA: flavin reductase family protein [Actinocrinis sp.]|nr:flavin reductase family protein [Actinocrinis sp.]
MGTNTAAAAAADASAQTAAAAADPGALTGLFREVMAGVCSPVSVVTAMTGDRPHGSTVSAFASLSLVPPMVLISLDQRSYLLTMIRDTGRFGVNVLGSHQAGLALTFAGKGADKFAGVPWQLDQNLPRLLGAPGWLACRAADFVIGGDHVIVLGEVTAAETTTAAPPLTYHRREFGTHSTSPAD